MDRTTPKPQPRARRLDLVPASPRPIVDVALVTRQLGPNRHRFAAASAGRAWADAVDANSVEEATVAAIARIRHELGERVRFVLDLPFRSPLWRLAPEVPALLSGATVERARPTDRAILRTARALLGVPERPKRRGEPITVATDGSVRGRVTAWGWLASSGERGLLGFVHDRRQVGPEVVLIAELRAIDAAVRSLRGDRITILSDCRRAIDFVNAWMDGDERLPGGYTTERGHRKAAGLVKAQRMIRAERDNLTVRWVRGHSGNPLNEGADGLARLASRYAKGDSGLTARDYRRRADGLASAFAAQHRLEASSCSA